MSDEDYGIDWVEDEIPKLEEIPSGDDYDGFLEDFGVPYWAPEYQRVLNAIEKRRQELRLERIDKNTQNIGGDDEPLRILKIRCAKGEITKEEFEEMKETMKT